MVGRLPASEQSAYQLRVTLEGIRPPIWRRIQAPGDISLIELHDILQTVMGWDDYHLHQFRVGGVDYAVPDPEEDQFYEYQAEDETQVRLSDLDLRENDKFFYDYDFGDGWKHEILVEKILPQDERKRCPVCTDGRRACPPEDCGGPFGYAGFLEATRDPKHPEHKMWLEWIGGEFDPEAFDLEEVNKRLGGT
jgi:hypothetical protein